MKKQTKITGTFWNLNKSKKHTFKTSILADGPQKISIVENNEVKIIDVYTVVIGPRLLTLRIEQI